MLLALEGGAAHAEWCAEHRRLYRGALCPFCRARALGLALDPEAKRNGRIRAAGQKRTRVTEALRELGRARKAAGESFRAVAAALGVAESTVHAWVRGRGSAWRRARAKRKRTRRSRSSA